MGTTKVENFTCFNNESDEYIVSLAQQGSNVAFACIICRYSKIIRAKSRLYYISGADSEDLFQEGMIGLYKAVRDYNFDKQALFRSFAELCVTRQIQSAVKSAARRKHEPLNSYVSLSKPAFSDEPEVVLLDTCQDNESQNPEDVVIDKEDYQLTESRIISVLSDFEQEVLSQYLLGKSYLDISVALDCSEKSVDNAIQRVKKKLIRHLKSRK